MSLLERNAAGFHYRVTYWPVDVPSESSTSRGSPSVHQLYDWTASELVVHGQRTFRPFVVYVQAVNDEGDAPTSFLEKRLGHTGQDGTIIFIAPRMVASQIHNTMHNTNKQNIINKLHR